LGFHLISSVLWCDYLFFLLYGTDIQEYKSGWYIEKNFIILIHPPLSVLFPTSPWYADIIYVLLNLQAPPRLSRTKKRFLKMKASKFCILDNAFFGKIMKVFY